jgi:hypothetical protein
MRELKQYTGHISVVRVEAGDWVWQACRHFSFHLLGQQGLGQIFGLLLLTQQPLYVTMQQQTGGCALAYNSYI